MSKGGFNERSILYSLDALRGGRHPCLQRQPMDRILHRASRGRHGEQIMKDWLILLVIVFLFYGEPDVWDKLHNYVMSMEVCK
jgi:hypothetical protein